MNDLTKAYNMDCLSAMRQTPDKYYDLAIVDPEYGIGEDGRKPRNSFDKRRPHLKPRPAKYKAKGWDNKPPEAEYFNELFRVSKNQIIWGGNYFTQFLPRSMGWIFWDKKTEAQDFSDGELAFTSFEKALKKYTVHKFKGTNGGKDCIHPCQKPIVLYKWLLKNYANPGDKILDTHLGSGSSRIAAYDMGFDFTGYELDPDYFKDQEARFNKHKRQLNLFTPQDVRAAVTQARLGFT